MPRRAKLDKIDLRILSIISRNPEICQTELADELGITQPAVCFRLKKLKKLGILGNNCTIDLRALGLKLVLAVGSADLNVLEENPYFVAGFEAGSKVYAIFAAENVETAESVARMLMRVEEIHVINKEVASFALDFEKIGECALPCNECEFYKKELCLGLPHTTWYRGKLWKLH